ncbi:MAG: RnfABCDGE type electron transport complex subunit C [Deltaproteobacteria bacterium]|nr:RnfABCDGE type electron transport complex subunit C [Deltaproteobacteria bacterium]
MDGFLPTFVRRKFRPEKLKEPDYRVVPERIGDPRIAIIPLHDYPSMPFKCLVSLHDKVQIGQKIGWKGKEPFDVSVLSPISGIVKEIANHPVPSGSRVMCVVIEKKDSDIEMVRSENLVRIKDKKRVLQEAGIPLEYKALTERGVEAIVVNGTEFEPNLTSTYTLLWHRTHEVINGLKLLMNLFSIKQGIVCIERKNKELLDRVKEHAESSGVAVVKAERSYPESGNLHLLRYVLKGKKRVLKEGKVIFVRPQDLIAIRDALEEGKPYLEKYVTVSGSAIGNPKNLIVKIGTTFSEVLEKLDVSLRHLSCVIMGGPLMGIPQPTLHVPITQFTDGIWALFSVDLTKTHRSKVYSEGVCVRCAKCVDSCPASIVPNVIVDFLKKGLKDRALDIGLNLCIECGLCSYVCPAKIPLSLIIRTEKTPEAKR